MALPSVNIIPDKLVDAAVYSGEGKQYYGMADIELPSFEPMSDTVKGVGIMGEIKTPTLGQFGAMSVKFKWNTSVTEDAFDLLVPGAHTLEFYGDMQHYDASGGLVVEKGVKVVVRGQCLKLGLGKLEKAKTMDADSEVSVEYIKVSCEGNTLIEYDPLNYVFVVRGEDRAVTMRRNLGKE